MVMNSSSPVSNQAAGLAESSAGGRENALPPPLMTSEEGSYARYTITDRMPQIIQQVLQDNSYGSETVRELIALRDEIASKPICPLREDAPDASLWAQELAPHSGKTWHEVGWYLAEAFFYRRLLEAVHYLQPGPWQGRDPFEEQKQKQVATAVQQMAAGFGELSCVEPDVAFEILLHSSLWGNRADLSNISVVARAHTGLAALEERQHILIDHTRKAQEYLARGVKRVDFVNDNVGLDLLFDLALADFLLAQRWSESVVFHLKDRPFFVSDAMPKDVLASVSALCASSGSGLRQLGRRILKRIEAGQLVLTDDAEMGHPFWTSCRMFRRLPAPLRCLISASNLVVLKGDVNYRRLLDDRHWPHTERLEAVVRYFPASLLALRTLKGEIMVGLAPGQSEALAAVDADWLTNGKRGLIHLVLHTRARQADVVGG